MSRVNTKFDISGLVLENTSLVHMALAVSHTRKIKSKEGTRRHRIVRDRRGSGTCKSQQGSLGTPSNTGRQTNGSLGATPSGIVSLCESSEKRIIEFIIGGEVLKKVAPLHHSASDWSTLISPVASQSAWLIVSCISSSSLLSWGELAEGDPAWGELAEGDPALGQFEDLLDVLTRILLAHLAGHHLKKHTALVDM